MIREAAVDLGLATKETVESFSTTSIRRGNQVTTEQEVQKFRAMRNTDNGWAKASFVPLQHYTPESVALAPGPLFWDLEAANRKYDTTMKEIIFTKLNSKMCPQCGFPITNNTISCDCKGCYDIITHASSKAHVAHGVNCWRRGQRKHGPLPPDVLERCMNEWRVHRPPPKPALNGRGPGTTSSETSAIKNCISCRSVMYTEMYR